MSHGSSGIKYQNHVTWFWLWHRWWYDIWHGTWLWILDSVVVAPFLKPSFRIMHQQKTTVGENQYCISSAPCYTSPYLPALGTVKATTFAILRVNNGVWFDYFVPFICLCFFVYWTFGTINSGIVWRSTLGIWPLTVSFDLRDLLFIPSSSSPQRFRVPNVPNILTMLSKRKDITYSLLRNGRLCPPWQGALVNHITFA